MMSVSVDVDNRKSKRKKENKKENKKQSREDDILNFLGRPSGFSTPKIRATQPEEALRPIAEASTLNRSATAKTHYRLRYTPRDIRQSPKALPPACATCRPVRLKSTPSTAGGHYANV